MQFSVHGLKSPQMQQGSTGNPNVARGSIDDRFRCLSWFQKSSDLICTSGKKEIPLHPEGTPDFFMHYYGGCKPYVSEEFQNLFHGSSSSSSFSYFAISLRLNPYETNADVWRTCVEAMPGRRRRPCLFT